MCLVMVIENIRKGEGGGERILKFMLAYNVLLVNTIHRKRYKHPITYNNSSSWREMKFFLTRKID